MTSESGGIQSFQIYNNQVLPGVASSQSLGSASFRWTQLFADSATISTSDAKSKMDVVEINNIERNVAIKLKGLIRRYKLKNAVMSKGDDMARYHIGVIAQEVEKAFADEGLNGFDYGLLCYDSWDYELGVYSDSGELIKPEVAAGEGYSVRYEELLCFIVSAL